MVHTDCAFCIGSSHSICEDYAIAGNDSVFVSDGCSSVNHSDVGARILARVANVNVPKLSDYSINEDDYFNKVIYDSWSISESLGMHRDSLFATLLALRLQQSKLFFHALGDGVLALVKANGDADIISIDFPSNAPKYLAYRLTKNDTIRFSSIDEGRKISQYKIRDNKCNAEPTIYERGSEYKDLYTGVFDRRDYKWAAIVSDGIFSFVRKEQRSEVPLTEVFADLFRKINNFKGSFIQRRLSRFMSEYAKEDKINYDDISMAGIIL